MSDLHAPSRQTPAARHMPFKPSLHIEPEDIWDWTPQQVAVMEAAAERNAPLQVKRPLSGSEGIPDTQPNMDDLLNTALAIITGIGLMVIISSLVRRITER